jgi:hypothetical protein
MTKTREEKLAMVAEKLGVVYHKPTPEEIASGSYYQYEPPYDTDANYKDPMLAVMTPEQFDELIARVVDYPINSPELLPRAYQWQLLAKLTQPTFFNLWGQVLGLWE